MGLSFVHPGFLLAGLLAVAVPVVIHLLFRQKPRRVEIGSVRFLKVALKDHARRRRVRRWLLMALRVAGVMLLALLFARPHLRGAPGAGRDREVVLVIDRSASMAAAVGGVSSFRRAQDAADAVLSGLPEQTAAHLAYADAAGVERAAAPRVDRSVGPGAAATDHGKALDWARDLMIVSGRHDRAVYYLTDLQRSGAASGDRPGWPEGVRVEVVDVGKPVPREVAVSDVRVDRAEVRAGEPVTVSAVVVNTGVLPARNVPVRLTLEGPTRPTAPPRSVTLEPGTSAEVTFPVVGLKPGVYRGSVDAEPRDDFPPDDRRWLAFEARSAETVLLVDGEPGPSVFGNETYYVEAALRLRPPGAGRSATPYDARRVARGGGSALPDLKGVSVVVACNVGDWTEGEASALREWVAAGGRLVLFGGRNVGPEAGERLRRARLVPAEVLGASAPGSYRVATWAKDHPFFRALSDPQHGDLRRLEFRRITRLKPDPDARVLAASGNGDPLLIEATVGAGTVVAFAVAADRDWGDWPVSRLYLPLIHQVLGGLTGRLPDDPRVVALASGPGPGERPGVTAAAAGGGVTVRNLAPAESEFERMTPDQFRRAFRLPGERPGASRDAPAPDDPDAPRPDELWRAVVWGLFAVLLLETFVANRTIG